MFSKKEIAYIVGVILIGLAIFFYKIHVGVLDIQGDYVGYVATAKFFAGLPGAIPSGQRILKPLEPLVNVLLAPSLGWQGSFLFFVALFYCLLVPAIWLFFREFFDSLFSSNTFLYTAAATALFCLSYPMLRYGLDAYTETGALFFYVLGLLGVWYFLKKPTWPILMFTLAAAVLGFFWKEYVVVPILILQIVTLWHPLLKGQTWRKLSYLVVFDGLFLIINLLWQFFVYSHFHYNYLEWFKEGGASGFQHNWSVFIVIKSLFALLIAGWAFVPFGFNLVKKNFFFWLIFLVPLICLTWGAVSSRLFYVCVPALAILCVLGIRRLIKTPHDQAAAVILLLAIDFGWLFFHL